MSDEEIIGCVLGIATLCWILGILLQLFLYGTVTDPCC